MQEQKKSSRTTQDKNVKRELRVNVSAEYASWINKQKERHREHLNDQ